jgi:hypothetical protein
MRTNPGGNREERKEAERKGEIEKYGQINARHRVKHLVPL